MFHAPDHVDKHIGTRITLMRTLRGMSQSELAAALDLTFQQVQKYEGGDTRISCSMLHRLSRVLNLPVAVFFDAMDDAPCPSLLDAPDSREC